MASTIGRGEKASQWHDMCAIAMRGVVDLLPDRDTNTVAAWVRQHAGTEIISRDCGRIFAEATRRVVSRAAQVADRWQLSHNLSEALCRARLHGITACFRTQQEPADRKPRTVPSSVTLLEPK